MRPTPHIVRTFNSAIITSMSVNVTAINCTTYCTECSEYMNKGKVFLHTSIALLNGTKEGQRNKRFH